MGAAEVGELLICDVPAGTTVETGTEFMVLFAPLGSGALAPMGDEGAAVWNAGAGAVRPCEEMGGETCPRETVGAAWAGRLAGREAEAPDEIGVEVGTDPGRWGDSAAIGRESAACLLDSKLLPCSNP